MTSTTAIYAAATTSKRMSLLEQLAAHNLLPDITPEAVANPRSRIF